MLFFNIRYRIGAPHTLGKLGYHRIVNDTCAAVMHTLLAQFAKAQLNVGDNLFALFVILEIGTQRLYIFIQQFVGVIIYIENSATKIYFY